MLKRWSKNWNPLLKGRGGVNLMIEIVRLSNLQHKHKAEADCYILFFET